MSVTLLSVKTRRAAHGKHVCRLCRRRIAARELYEDMRCAYSGTAYTVRAHLACVSAWNSWWAYTDGDEDLVYVADGHLPPCPQAWADHEDEACTCEVVT